MTRQELLAKAAPVREAYGEHGLATHAAAIAFRVLVALVPLVLLSVALLGALGLEDVWHDEIAPALQERLTRPVFEAIDYSVTEIFASPKLTLIVFAAALLLWELFRGVRAVSRALNVIHEVDESRGWRRLGLVTLGLSVGVGACVIASMLVTIVGGRVGVLASIARWPVAVVLLGVAAGLLVRYAPAERPDVRWASLGSAVIVAGWLLLSAGFGVWVAEIASYKSAAGTLLAFLVLTAYALAVSAVFLIGVEIDETARTGTASTRRRGGRSGRARPSSSR
jgi:membrane protein